MHVTVAVERNMAQLSQ